MKPLSRVVSVVADEEGHVPSYAHSADAGADLRAVHDSSIEPGGVVSVGTGVRVQIPEGFVGLVCPRSGLAKHGITVANAPGIVDSGYQGEVRVLLYNMKDHIQSVLKGERIAQLVFVPFMKADPFYLVPEFENSTDRGDNGFGSTGK